jgi:hypothetical protein
MTITVTHRPWQGWQAAIIQIQTIVMLGYGPPYGYNAVLLTITRRTERLGERTSEEDKWTRMLNYDTNEQRSVPVPLGGLTDPKHDINTRNNHAHNFGTRGRRGTHLGLAPRHRALRGHQRVCQLHMPPVSLWPPYRLCICPIIGGETILWQRMV